MPGGVVYKGSMRLGTKGRKVNGTVDWELRETGKGLEFAAQCSMYQGTKESYGGQALDSCLADFPNNKQLRRIHNVWKRWHLNCMKAGCEHQRAEGWEDRPIDPTKPTDTYGRWLGEQGPTTWNMLTWVRRSEHPQGLMCEPCPVCGYKYGTSWLAEQLPQDVIDEIKSWKSNG